ncbi:MAG: Ig-like domain-containing protein, partial [Clostridia bacterium]|nr:Ig-like domain-containing protein [Clostridia bacterium]
AEAVWTACDYVSSNPEVVKVDPYSGRITALAEGEATITATHVERGFVDTCTVKVENKPEHICTPAEKWSADETAHWLECTDPECGEIINYAEHSGGTATVKTKAVCEYCGTAYGEYASASFSVEAVSDIAYCKREKREYKLTVAENADKVQFIRDSGSTTTFVRSQAAEIINNGDGTETWILAVSLNKGKYTLATKYGKVWNKNGIEFEIVFDTPKCRSFTSEKVGNLTTFTVVTDPQVAKIQLITQSGNTLTYTQSNSYIGEDGLRYWTVVRKITKPGTIGLRTKYGYTWTTTDFTIDV